MVNLKKKARENGKFVLAKDKNEDNNEATLNV